MTSLFARLFVILTCVSIRITAVGSDEDFYVREAHIQCNVSGGFVPCTKYKLSRYISMSISAVSGAVWRSGSMALVAVDGAEESRGLIAADRQIPGDSEVMGFVKFLSRQLWNVLIKLGLMIELPEGAKVILDTDSKVPRLHKKKKGGGGGIIFPLLVILKLIKLKFLMEKALWGIFVIKVLIIAGGLILSNAIKSIKKECALHHKHTYIEDPFHAHEPFTTYEGYIDGQGKDYGSDWERIYRHIHLHPDQRE